MVINDQLAQMAPVKQPFLTLTLLLALAAVSMGAPTAEEKMALIGGGFAAFAKGDIPTFLSMFAEDHVYRLEGGPELPWSGVRTGQDSLLKAIGVFTQYANFTVHDLDLFASPTTGRIVAQYDLKGAALSTGHPIEEPCFLRFVVGDDLRVHETMEACNALKEYRIFIQGRSGDGPGGEECAQAV